MLNSKRSQLKFFHDKLMHITNQRGNYHETIEIRFQYEIKTLRVLWMNNCLNIRF